MRTHVGARSSEIVEQKKKRRKEEKKKRRKEEKKKRRKEENERTCSRTSTLCISDASSANGLPLACAIAKSIAPARMEDVPMPEPCGRLDHVRTRRPLPIFWRSWSFSEANLMAEPVRDDSDNSDEEEFPEDPPPISRKLRSAMRSSARTPALSSAAGAEGTQWSRRPSSVRTITGGLSPTTRCSSSASMRSA